MKKHASLLIFIAIGALLTGCVSNSGPAYHDLGTSAALAPHSGKAMVFIYNNEDGMLGSGNPGAYIFANDVQLPGRLPNNSFISYEAAPGKLTVAVADLPDKASTTSDVVSSVLYGPLGYAVNRAEHHRYGVDIDVVAGQTYYFKCTDSLHQVPADQGQNDIKNCKWQNAIANNNT